MAAWAYRCRLCPDDGHEYFVSAERAAELPAGTRLVRLRMGGQWRCARIDLGRRVSVEGLLIRQVAAADAAECPECREA